jgi:uncharacterized protein
MSLNFNIRHVEDRDLELEGELPVEELDLDTRDEAMQVAGPLNYALEAQKLEGGVLVTGSLSLPMQFECVRCLKKFQSSVELPDWTAHLPLVGYDAVSINNDMVDLTPVVREDILLALPQHPLCKSDCSGIEMPASLKGPGEASEQTSSAWDELNKLKL